MSSDPPNISQRSIVPSSSSSSQVNFAPSSSSASSKGELETFYEARFYQIQETDPLKKFTIYMAHAVDKKIGDLKGSATRKEITNRFFKEIYSDNKTPLEIIASKVANIVKHRSPNTKNLIKKIALLVFEQHVDDLEHFVSHGFNHSLNVANYICDLADKTKVIKRISKFYDLSKRKSKFVVFLIGILHDCGYPNLEGKTKANHAVEGAIKVDELKCKLLKFLYRENSSTPTRIRKRLFYYFRNAIFLHSADKCDRDYHAKVITRHKGAFLCKIEHLEELVGKLNGEVSAIQTSHELITNYLYVSNEYKIIITSKRDEFKGRAIDFNPPVNGKKDEKLGLPFSRAHLSQSPFQFLIRFADNMDISKYRFSPLQRREEFQRVYHEIAENTNGETNLKIAEQICKDLSARTKEEIIAVAKYLDKNSRSHFGGCECIEKVVFSIALESITMVKNDKFIPKISKVLNLDIWVNEALRNKLNQIPINNERDILGLSVNTSVGDYQIWRTQEAFRSLTGRFKSIKLQIVNKDTNQVLAGLTVDHKKEKEHLE